MSKKPSDRYHHHHGLMGGGRAKDDEVEDAHTPPEAFFQ